MKKNVALALGAIMLSVGAPALAQKAPAAKAAPAAVALTKDQQDHAVQTFGIVASAMQSANVPNDVKVVLMACVYDNSIGNISETVDKVIAANPGKVDRTKPDQLLSVIAQICGYQPTADAAAGSATPTPKATTPPASTPKGR
jgi:hypothetical protein